MTDQQISCCAKCSGSIHQIVYNNYILAGYITNNFHCGHGIGFQPFFIDHHHISTQILFVLLNAFDAAKIGTTQTQVINIGLLNMIYKKFKRRQWINRDFIESLNGIGVQVEGNKPIGTHQLNHVGHHPRRNGCALSVSSFLATVW